MVLLLHEPRTLQTHLVYYNANGSYSKLITLDIYKDSTWI